MDRENFRKLLSIIKHLDGLAVSVPQTSTPIEASPRDALRSVKMSSSTLDRNYSRAKPADEPGLGSDFDESIICDITPKMLGLLFDRIQQMVELEIPERIDKLLLELSTIAEAELAARQKHSNAVQASDKQFDENQKLRNELKLEVKEKQTAISINKDLRERLHELQLKESQSHRLASRVKDLEKLLVNSSASGLHEEKALRSMHELDEVRTQLMAAENALTIALDSASRWKQAFGKQRLKLNIMSKIVSRRRVCYRKKAAPHRRINFGVNRLETSGLLRRITTSAFDGTPRPLPTRRFGSQEESSLFSELAKQSEDSIQLEELRVELAQQEQRRKVAESDVERMTGQLQIQEREAAKLAASLAEKDASLAKFEEQNGELQKELDEAQNRAQPGGVEAAHWKAVADLKAKTALVASLRVEVRERDELISQRVNQIDDLLLRIKELKAALTQSEVVAPITVEPPRLLDAIQPAVQPDIKHKGIKHKAIRPKSVKPKATRSKTVQSEVIQSTTQPEAIQPEVPSAEAPFAVSKAFESELPKTSDSSLEDELRKTDREWRAKLDDQRDKYLERIHRVQRDLMEKETEVRDLIRRGFTDSGELQPKVSIERIDHLVEQSKKQAFLSPSTGTKKFRLQIPGAVTTIRVPADVAVRYEDIILHVAYPPQVLLVNPVTRSFSVEGIDRSASTVLGQYSQATMVDLGAKQEQEKIMTTMKST